MFDDRSKTYEGRTKRKQSDGKQNRKQKQNKKRFKPSGELVNNKETIKTTTTDKESTCMPSQTVSIGIKSRKRNRSESKVDDTPNEMCRLNCHKGRLIWKIRKIVNKPCYTMSRLSFHFKNNDNAAQTNAKILKSNTWNLRNVIEQYKHTVFHLGTEFRAIEDL